MFYDMLLRIHVLAILQKINLFIVIFKFVFHILNNAQFLFASILPNFHYKKNKVLNITNYCGRLELSSIDLISLFFPES